jgi:hypothetical protein
MDRRYRESRFYNGAPASDRGERGRDTIVRRHLERARRANASAQSYGGSTGGTRSAGGNSGLEVIRQRNASIKDQREAFRQYGSGSLGGRANLAELQGFRQPASASA